MTTHTDNNINKAVLFDLDGTLIDSAPDFISTFEYLQKKHKLAPIDNTLLRNTVSDGANAMIELTFGVSINDPKHAALREEVLDCYEDHLGASSHTFAGITQLIKQLDDDNIRWGIVTNKPERFATPLVAALGDQLQPAPQTLICPDHVSAAKPSPESLYLACKEINCDPSNTIYIGDHERDIVAGKAAGMVTIAAQYGYLKDPNEAIAWQADLIASSVEDMYPFIKATFE